jgi:preprotein translocase subunit SecF
MDFIGKRKIWFTISLILIFMSISGMVFNWASRGGAMNFGIDFTGGTLLLLRFENHVSTGDVRDILIKYGLEKSVIQRTGKNDISIRAEMIDDEKRVALIAELDKTFGGVELLEADLVGPVIGEELRTQAIWALLVASILMVIYITFRFEFKYAMAAIFALYHDAIITTGIVALIWRDVNTPFVAAILTILGYSINATIVIFDRIRENIKRAGAKKVNFADVVNAGVSQTIARSINTALTTIFMVLMLFLFGGTTIKDFALILMIGFTAGTYSSIFIASSIVFAFDKWGKR